MKRRAFSIMELILGVFLILMALVVFLNVFSASSRQSLQSRNRTVAIMLANSMMDEIEAHPYGAPQPGNWLYSVDHPVRVWVEGNEQEMSFHKKLTFDPPNGNGSFIGTVPGDTDEVTVTISWREGVGIPQAGVVDPKDNKVLKVRVPVWR